MRVYWKVLKVSLQARLEYRADAVLSILGSLGLQAAGLGTMWMVLRHGQGLAGWNGREVALLFGLTTMIQGFSELMFNQIWFLPVHIVQGQLDRLLTYPVKTLPFYLMTSPELHALGNLGGGFIIFCLAASSLELPWWRFLPLPLWIACGSLIHTAGLVACASFSFKMLGRKVQHYFIIQNLLQASRYPLGVFPTAMQVVLLLLIPFATASFLPAHWMLHGAPLAAALLAPVAAASLFTWLAFKFWNWGLGNYESTGS